jgi:hypothetical protein
MALHRWKLRLEIETDQGKDEKDSMVIELTEDHDTNIDNLSVNESLAMDMGAICRMVIESQRVVGATDMQSSKYFFWENDE